MRLSFELTEDDLRDLQLLQLALRRTRVLTSTGYFLLTVVGAGLLLWPVYRWGMERIPGAPTGWDQLGVYLVAVAIAAAVAALLRRRFPVPRFSRLRAWSAGRMTRSALNRSILGPVSIELGPEAIVRTNPVDALRVPWAGIVRLVCAPRLCALWVAGGRRVLLLPSRAFADPRSLQAFRAEVETRTGKRFEDVPEP